MPIIAPSLLSANFLNLDADCKMLNESQADWYHLDIMDGRFVPNISFGPMLVSFFRKATTKVCDVHLMIEEPGKYAEQFNLEIFVETGTCCGDMVEAMKNSFKRIYSIELSDHFYEEAKKRFRNQTNIELIHGDSGKELEKLMQRINSPTLFWLDGHYSGGMTAKGDNVTPIFAELDHVIGSTNPRHVILIDDASCFHEDPEYPDLSDLYLFINSRTTNVKIINIINEINFQ
jgi:hypothetical protein